MRAILQIDQNDINDLLLQTIKQLLRQNSEILIQPSVNLEEYNASQSLGEVMQALSNEGHNINFLSDLEKGFKSSSLYAKNAD